MSKETKTIMSSVNLPINVVKTLLNIDDREVNVPIESLIQQLNDRIIESVRTMNETAEIDPGYESPKYVEPQHITQSFDIAYISSIEKKTINAENMDSIKKNLKFYEIELEYIDGRVETLIVPSYMKFYSSHKGTFIAVEKLVNRDILKDYYGRMVKVSDAKLIDNPEIPSEYYNIKVTFERKHSEDEELKEYPSIYINGVLTNVAYYNFNRSFGSDASEDKENKD